MRLGFNYTGYSSSFVYSDSRPMPPEEAQTICYARTKIIADGLVRKANGVKGLKTGVVG